MSKLLKVMILGLFVAGSSLILNSGNDEGDNKKIKFGDDSIFLKKNQNTAMHILASQGYDAKELDEFLSEKKDEDRKKMLTVRNRPRNNERPLDIAIRKTFQRKELKDPKRRAFIKVLLKHYDNLDLSTDYEGKKGKKLFMGEKRAKRWLNIRDTLMSEKEKEKEEEKKMPEDDEEKISYVGQECPLCYEELVTGDQIAFGAHDGGEKHPFHYPFCPDDPDTSAKKWIEEHKECPICRGDLELEKHSNGVYHIIKIEE